MRLSIKTGKSFSFLFLFFSSTVKWLTSARRCVAIGFASLIVLISVMAWAKASVDVTANVDREGLNPGDTLTLTVSVTSNDDVNADSPNLPPLNDFEVINQWATQEARSNFITTPSGPQFQSVQTHRYNYMLQPKHQGTLSIPGVEMIVDGKRHVTKPISIKVAPGAGVASRQKQSQPQGFGQPPPGFGEDDEDDVFQQLLRRQAPQVAGSRQLNINTNEAFFVQLDTDKKDVYVGEQITASWYLYTRGIIRDLDTLKYPALHGFWKEDIEMATHLNFETELVNGIPYKKALLASFALFPIKDGTPTIDPYVAKCSVISGDDPMGFGKANQYTKASNELKVTVHPVPADGRPADFSGAVGDFQLTSRIDDKNPVTNQPFALKIRFEGHGNAKLIDLPPFEPPQGIEIYETQKDAKFFRTGSSYKEFTVMLIPRAEGDFTIPAVSTSVFDPKEKKYVRKTTEPVHVHVAKGTGKEGADSPMAASGETKPTKKSATDTEPELDLRLRSGLLSRMSVSNAQMGFVYGLVFLLVFLFLLLRARKELGWGMKKKDLSRQLKVRLKRVDAKVIAGDWRGVGIEMTNTAYFVLGAISGEGGANVELGKLLLRAPPSVRRELGEDIRKQMEIFQILSFAPEQTVGNLKDSGSIKSSVGEMSRLLERAVELAVSSGQSAESVSNPKAF